MSLPGNVTASARSRPLAGRRVLVTRPAGQAQEFIRQLRDAGAEPVLCPTIRIVPPEDYQPLDAAIRRLHEYTWLIFTSVNGVRFFFERLDSLHRGVASVRHLKVGAIGPATARAIAGRGVSVDFVPAEYVAEAIVAGIGDVRGARVLLPRADIARQALVEGLQAKGAEIDEVTAYRTLAAEIEDVQWLFRPGATVDIATFTSPSTVQHFVAMVEERPARELLADAIIACIGPITAEAVRSVGLRVDVEAPEHTLSGLLQAIVQYIEEQK